MTLNWTCNETTKPVGKVVTLLKIFSCEETTQPPGNSHGIKTTKKEIDVSKPKNINIFCQWAI